MIPENINYYYHKSSTNPFAKFSLLIVILLPLAVVFGLHSKLFLLVDSSNPVFPVLFVFPKLKVVEGLSNPLMDRIVMADICSLKSGIKDLKQVLSFYLTNSSLVNWGSRFFEAVMSLLFYTILTPSQRFKNGTEENCRSLLLL